MSNSSLNFEVIYDDPNGLLFKNKRDEKILNVDPMVGFLLLLLLPVLFLIARETNGTPN